MAQLVDVTDSTFDQEVLQADKPVLVDFWAPWCGPCRQIAPMIDQLASENVGSVKVGKVNTDENPNTAMAYGIEAIPTLIVFKGGQPVTRFQGARSKSALQAALDEAKG